MTKVDMFTKFCTSAFKKYGNRNYPEIANGLISEGRLLNRVGGQTSKGMKWAKYYDYDTGKLLAYEQAYKGQAKMVLYDIPDATPTTILKLGKTGKIYLSGEGTWDKSGMLQYLDYLTNNVHVRCPLYKELPTGHNWLYYA